MLNVTQTLLGVCVSLALAEQTQILIIGHNTTSPFYVEVQQRKHELTTRKGKEKHTKF